MNNRCKCGGKVSVVESNAVYFRSKCSACGRTNKQKKRQAAIQKFRELKPTVWQRRDLQKEST